METAETIRNYDREQKIRMAYDAYYKWWHPIDIECGSCLSAMTFNAFCETLLTYGDVWWNRWMGSSSLRTSKEVMRDKMYDKKMLLKLIGMHYMNIDKK